MKVVCSQNPKFEQNEGTIETSKIKLSQNVEYSGHTKGSKYTIVGSLSQKTAVDWSPDTEWLLVLYSNNCWEPNEFLVCAAFYLLRRSGETKICEIKNVMGPKFNKTFEV